MRVVALRPPPPQRVGGVVRLSEQFLGPLKVHAMKDATSALAASRAAPGPRRASWLWSVGFSRRLYHKIPRRTGRRPGRAAACACAGVGRVRAHASGYVRSPHTFSITVPSAPRRRAASVLASLWWPRGGLGSPGRCVCAPFAPAAGSRARRMLLPCVEAARALPAPGTEAF